MSGGPRIVVELSDAVGSPVSPQTPRTPHTPHREPQSAEAEGSRLVAPPAVLRRVSGRIRVSR